MKTVEGIPIPDNLFRLMPEEEQQRSMNNISVGINNSPSEIHIKMVEHFKRADKNYEKEYQ